MDCDFGRSGGTWAFGNQVAKARGYRVIAIDHFTKAKLCAKLGSDIFFALTQDKIPEKVRALTDGLGAHAVAVAGSPSAWIARSFATAVQ
jgi:D-arabinose 1-dehydrogenase-like Zn-dependent alcohol dehydrogenase